LDIEALLFRDSVKIDRVRLGRLIAGQRVAITGGGGSIGGEIAQRIAALGAAHILIIENSEPMLHQILEKLESQPCCGNVEGVLGDIRDAERIFQVLRDFKPDLVLHAAALKQVPYLEVHWGEAIKTNIFGSKNVLQASADSGAKAVVMISTDKAIDPVSILGVTKRFAELYAQMLDQEIRSQATSKCRVISVRFGNVLGSNGSVIPKFRSQIASGGPVTVTDPEMVRYFMTVREASELVLSAASHALETDSNLVHSSVYVLKMGQQVRILDLARNLIRLSGFEPDVDIPIIFTGVRPGERLHEIMFDSTEEVTETGIDGVLAAAPNSATRELMTIWLHELNEAVAVLDRVRAEKVFLEAVPNFNPAVLTA
jgi:O-antigen biosynthesis protein WbqV